MTLYFRGTDGNNRIQADGGTSYGEKITMYGYGGDDLLYGWLHSPLNTAYGGSGNDTIQGGAWSNTLYGDDGSDQLTVSFSSGTNKLYGGAGNDYLQGGTNTVLSTRPHPVNILDGGAGSDTMVGSEGMDTYVVNSVYDVVREAYVPFFDNDPNPRDLVRASVSYSLGSNLEDLTLIGARSINGTGNALHNRITGNAASNILNGGAGRDSLDGGAGNDVLVGGNANDRLTGGAGKDLLTGGAGNDVFDFDAVVDSGLTAEARDVISDFQRGTSTVPVDRIDLSTIDAKSSTPTNDAFRFIGIAAFSATDASGQLRVTYSNGVATLFGSTDADADAEFSIQLNGVSGLRAVDFLL